MKKQSQKKNAQQFFSSHDIGLVAFLLSKKFELIDLDKTLKSKVLFILKRDDDIDNAIKNYWNFKSSVDAQTYFNQLKRLKNQIFSSN
ncbi:MAG: hypothetical protein KAQ87_00150 [Candidatus Pacebacteria bacterium]|nr:hypothetical protein [Candidatus Paceibacterota bacterium]